MGSLALGAVGLLSALTHPLAHIPIIMRIRIGICSAVLNLTRRSLLTGTPMRMSVGFCPLRNSPAEAVSRNPLGTFLADFIYI